MYCSSLSNTLFIAHYRPEMQACFFESSLNHFHSYKSFTNSHLVLFCVPDSRFQSSYQLAQKCAPSLF